MSVAFERLHPAVRHHIVNSLGWRTLRPLQERAIDPILAGDHALLGAPTAGGKTEAAVFPLLSRMVDEGWGGASVLYVCPLRALLNNLLPRLEGYCSLLGRRAALWHGDVGQGDRRRALADPPDVLLTTPESIEAMFMSRRVDAGDFFRSVRAVVVDEIHAFAGDDRGWHTLAVLNRLDAVGGREIPRIGLTATVGNPDWLLDWLVCGGEGARSVVMEDGAGTTPLDLEIDWVANLPNAARVISALHHGEKRLVFADSRARVESLAAELRGLGTTTYVSHSSLSRDDRRQAEGAFAEGRDCVIVATSTLELGIDVGDLDRVIQIGAPRTVASVLQRTGRTGRRPGTARNCLFLATSEMELMVATALVRLVRQGWVEPITPPPYPVHLVAQQLLARLLSEGRVGRSSWPGDFSRVQRQAGLDPDLAQRVLEHMLRLGIVVEDGGILGMGHTGEAEYGRRHFMDVTSLFLTAPLLTVRWGQKEVGSVDSSALVVRDGRRSALLLGGRAWKVRSVDWDRRAVWVEPTEGAGRTRWAGQGGALSAQVSRAVRDVLVDSSPIADALSARAVDKLAEVSNEHAWARPVTTTVVRDAVRERSRWWTFAGGRANRDLANVLDAAGVETGAVDDLTIGLDEHPAPSRLELALADGVAGGESPVDPKRLASIKFSACVPAGDLARMVAARDSDPDAAEAAAVESISFSRLG